MTMENQFVLKSPTFLCKNFENLCLLMLLRFYLQRNKGIWTEMRIKSLANEDGHFKLECLLLFMLILYGKWLYDLIFMKITATLSQEVILNDLT